MEFRTRRRSTLTRRAGLAALGLALALSVAGCDNIVKLIPTFSVMTEGPAVQTYEEEPVPPPEGTLPVDGERRPGLLEADTLLENPLAEHEVDLERGRETYEIFCEACHGATGQGDGPVINVDGQHPRRLPEMPALDLTGEMTVERSDGYIWGIIQEGRGLMPEYRRIPDDERWHLVEYVRHLQREAGAEPGGGAGEPGASAESGAGGGR